MFTHPNEGGGGGGGGHYLTSAVNQQLTAPGFLYLTVIYTETERSYSRLWQRSGVEGTSW